MLASSLTLHNAAAAAKTLTLVFQQGQESRRVDTSAPLRTLRIQHQVSGKASARANRHNATLSQSYVDANGVAQTTSVSFTMAISLDPTAAAYADDLVAMAIDLITTSGVIASLKLGES